MAAYSPSGASSYYPTQTNPPPHPATNTEQRKSFFFMIDKMETSGEEQPTWVPPGIWVPPTGSGENIRIPGDTTGVWFLFNGTAVQRMDAEFHQQWAPHLEHYRDMSIYHDQSRFWALPCDAAMTEITENWRLVGFRHDADPQQTYASYVMLGGPEDRLRCQRPAQRWPRTLLPPNLQCSEFTADEYSHFGGMIGELNIIIALMAFSVRASHVEQALPECMVRDRWRGPTISESRIGKGWKDKRGVIVRIRTISTLPNGMTREDLMRFEGGYSGKILS